MTIKSDKWIRRMAEEHGMISPFEPEMIREKEGKKIVSFGTSSYGYDIRCAPEFRVFTNINSTIVDPKSFDPNSFVEFNNKDSFKLIFNINSGEKFIFNELTLVLSDDYDSKYFMKINESLVDLKNQEYSLDKVEKILREVDKIALTKQYQFIDASLDETIIGKDKLNILFSLKDSDSIIFLLISASPSREIL